MERLMAVTTFQKAIDSLKTTECSQKEKLILFTQISDSIQSPALRGNVNYLVYVSNAVSILLMFCEDVDSVVRMSAEENLNRVIRFSTPTNVVRIQYDLFQEIKRNGNDRSLRIALNHFGHYAHMIKQRKVKPYALNLLPCILSISQRKEQQLIETLSQFFDKFCTFFQISLTENEVSNLIEFFLKDAISSECPVKRRCSASNVMTLIEHARRPDVMAKHALTLCLENLVKDFTLNTIVGALGLLRILLPKLLTTISLELYVIQKIIEIYELCLHLLSDSNHTIINASLECLSVILNHSKPQLSNLLINDKLIHMEVLCKKRSLKNQIFHRKLSTPSIDTSSKNQLISSPSDVAKMKKLSSHVHSSTMTKELDNSESDISNVLDYVTAHNASVDDKGLLTGSDIELDSLRLNDFELCQSNESLVQLSGRNSPAIKKTPTSNPLKSQKSTDSIGSFLNTLIHPNTESVTKFFRVGSLGQQSDTQSSTIENLADDLNQTDVNISETSDGSMLSINSSAFDMLNRTDDSIPEIEILNEQEIATIRLEADEMNREKSDDMDQTIDAASTVHFETIDRELLIGSISNQPLIYYTVRLIASKFLLVGVPYKLIDDCDVRVSIKNLSLAVIGHCVALCPRTLLLSLQYNGPENLEFEHESDSEESICSKSEKNSPLKTKPNNDQADQLNIKDDHFGENSKVPNTYFDFFFPLSKSADNVLLSRLNSDNIGADNNRRTQKKLIGDLSDLLSKSDILDSKPSYKNLDITTETSQNTNEKSTINSQALIQSITDDGSLQFVEDILLFWNHSDPILRANVQLVAGNFLFSVLNECESIANFFEHLEIASTYRFLNFNVLFNILIKGLSDEIHTVVKQSLVSLEKFFSILLDHRSSWFYRGDACMQPIVTCTEDFPIEYCHISTSISLLEEILDKLPLVFENKYWVIQNKYCRFIATINYDAIEEIFGLDKGREYKNLFVSHMYAMLKDTDARIRNEAATAIFEFNLSQAMRKTNVAHKHASDTLTIEFVTETLSNEVPFSMVNSTGTLTGYQSGLGDVGHRQLKRVLGKHLHDLTNKLFDLKSTEQLLGATKCLLNTINSFSPIQFVEIWSEYNVLDICVELLISNYPTGIDLSSQCDLLTISSNLLAAMNLRKLPDANGQRKAITSSLLGHVMKLLSIYHNVLINKRPVFIPKGQKADLFVNSKEVQLLNSYGYFGNDYFYLKIYKILRIIYENYKITINEEIDLKLFSLLRVCLRTMALLIEIMEPFTDTESTSFFDEILIYIKTTLIYEPKMSVVCIKHLIRNMFLMTYPNWKIDENLFDYERIQTMAPHKMFDYLDEIRCQTPVPQKTSVNTTPSHAGSKLINFLASTSTPEKQKTNSDHRNIKIFEPIVIQCLKLFTKSDSEMQSYVLEMLCQVLQLKVNYCLLDANNIFMEFLLKLIESIETGIIRNSHILTPKIIKILFYLAKQKEKPQMTIPKIINITDNLLANSITKNGSVEALYQLSYEIYFPRRIDNEPVEDSQQNTKEKNTQKEVVFSMLLKFIDSIKVKKMICMILMKETSGSKEIHAELAECLLHTLSDQKVLVTTLDDYHLLRKMCTHIRPYLIQEKANCLRLVSRLQRRSDSILDDVAVKSIVLECISEVTDESTVLACVANKLDATAVNILAESIRNDLISSISYTGFEYNLLFEGNLCKIIEFLQILECYLNAITIILRNYNETAQSFKSYFGVDSKFLEIVLNFMKNLPSIANSSNISQRTNWCTIKMNFANRLFAFIFDLYETSVFVDAIMKKAQENHERARTLYDQCVTSILIQTLTSKTLDHVVIDFLLQNYFIEILFINSKFIVNTVKSGDFIDLILSKLSCMLQENIQQKNILFLFLDAIEVCDEKFTLLSTNHLLETTVIFEEGSPVARRSFSILRNKLVHLNDTTNSQTELIASLNKFKAMYQHHDMFSLVSKHIEEILAENLEKMPASDEMNVNIPINEDWFHNKAIDIMKSDINNRRIFQILSEVKLEQKLIKIFEQSHGDVDVHLLPILIQCSFETMTSKFKHDCFQHNAHMNYLKLSPILKQSINTLCNKMDVIFAKLEQNSENLNATQTTDHDTIIQLKEVMTAVSVLLECLAELQQQCMIYAEVSFVNKFLDEHMFRMLSFQRLVRFSSICLNSIEHLPVNETFLEIACNCINHILRTQATFNESNNFFATNESHDFFNRLLTILYEIIRKNFASQLFLEKNQLKTILNERTQTDFNKTDTADLSYARAIFLGVFVENCFDPKEEKTQQNANQLNTFKDTVLSLTVATLRSESFYFYAVTPREIINSFDWQQSANQTTTFQSVPIDCLNEIEIVEKFLKRINIFGFPLRQHFEEFFMSLLLLINKVNDENIVDAQEEYQIKNVCLSALLELLISCKMYPNIGDRLNGMFHHVPRQQRLIADSISLRKLHGIQNELMRPPSVFYLPNLERCDVPTNNIIGTETFHSQQYDLNVIWHIIEGQPAASRSINIELKNMKHFLDASAIDFNSSIQLTFDVLTQLLEVNSIQILPHIVKFAELCENREQFHWIKNVMNKLHESIPKENAIAHQHIAYCLCKSYAILIPSVQDINHLCHPLVLGNYLKSSHLFVRTAALRGVLLIFESCIKSNTTIGSLSEEILLLRTFISNYITHHGLIEESSLSFSNEHAILVWTLNFYVIETTSKFIPDCDMMANQTALGLIIMSANNVLKRTTSLTLFLCIIHGLERVIISKIATDYYHQKIERLALDLVKLENEQFSLSALKLLMTCMYIGSNEQLENTERCNGIVQDEPEVIMQTTEKIEIFYQRIKLATSPGAHIYGYALCQLTHDLVPPKELLTKVIKEFLTVSQPHCEVIATLVFQVFRSAIDSAYLPLLQDWLLCSLPNFLSFSTPKIMWYLIVIFISSSINLSLIKIFPQVLADYNAIFNNSIRDKMNKRHDILTSTSASLPIKYKDATSECVAIRQRTLFILACKDFYERLSCEQKRTFRDIFSNMQEQEIYNMLKAL
ncbi:huntingtin [Contarinia nasturtii]|uniref:huntingtin n=1 Tax=Contarinia nasturtii TaxID=265458 RepID=UPI0012D43FF9|nr:huntingtin [Contarinia nasturtii]